MKGYASRLLDTLEEKKKVQKGDKWGALRVSYIEGKSCSG